MEFGEHKVKTHLGETDLSVVYTIDPAVVNDYINTVEQLLARGKVQGGRVRPRVHPRSCRVSSQGRRRPDVRAPPRPCLPLLPSHKAMREF